jgi:HD-GYP domain-containing protein (c-di-GMP phosphodiesterase class II)
MRTPVPNASLKETNPHLLAAIAEASERCEIFAARDIVDSNGVKLWARHRAVSRVLQERLAARTLAAPLESALAVSDGVSSASLGTALHGLLEAESPLLALLRPHAAALSQGVGRLHLHPVVATLLTVAREIQPKLFDHALRAMALAGALSLESDASESALGLALLGGLLHDLGEMYIDPSYVAGGALDAVAMTQLAAHPHVGARLLAELTDYPPALARGVAEHHERLDGSGYPMGKHGNNIRSLGRLLAVVETVLGVVDAPLPAPLWRARLAIGTLPSEYEQRWTSLLGAAARADRQVLEHGPRLDAAQMQTRLRQLDQDLQQAQDEAQAMCFDNANPSLRAVAQFVVERLAALRTAWNESGLWAIDERYDPANGGGEFEWMERELHHRMKSTWRNCTLRSVDLNSVERELLEPIHDLLCGEEK